MGAEATSIFFPVVGRAAVQPPATSASSPTPTRAARRGIRLGAYHSDSHAPCLRPGRLVRLAIDPRTRTECRTCGPGAAGHIVGGLARIAPQVPVLFARGERYSSG